MLLTNLHKIVLKTFLFTLLEAGFHTIDIYLIIWGLDTICHMITFSRVHPCVPIFLRYSIRIEIPRENVRERQYRRSWRNRKRGIVSFNWRLIFIDRL